jgi:hypothetical protein
MDKLFSVGKDMLQQQLSGQGQNQGTLLPFPPKQTRHKLPLVGLGLSPLHKTNQQPLLPKLPHHETGW